jgi:hypothetical protein
LVLPFPSFSEYHYIVVRYLLVVSLHPFRTFVLVLGRKHCLAGHDLFGICSLSFGGRVGPGGIPVDRGCARREPGPALYDLAWQRMVGINGYANLTFLCRISKHFVSESGYKVHDFLEGRGRNGRSGDRDKYSKIVAAKLFVRLDLMLAANEDFV